MKELKMVLKWVRNILILFFGTSILAVLVLKYVPVYYTPLMISRLFDQKSEGKEMKLHHHWVPMEEISQNMAQAVMSSEDNLFLKHNGFDYEQIKIAYKEREKRQRGASTISQQTAKNVFLWQGHSFVRKGLEAYFTVLIEWIWGKERIMEVYLNSIEMGDGIYGVEAVAQDNFNKTASDLSKREAACIAATLPNPLRFDSAHPSKYIRRRTEKIMSLMGKIDRAEMGCKPSGTRKK